MCDHPLPRPPLKPASILTLYAVRNHEGRWFRSVGYGGHGQQWVDDIQRAKIYAKIGQARARVTYFANLTDDLPPPDLVELTVTRSRVIDEAKRVAKAKAAKKTEKQRRAAANAKWRLELAQEDLKRAQEALDREKGKP